MRRTLWIIMSFMMITQCTIGVEPTVINQPRNWWGDAVFYEIFVRSFLDTNHDGIGDLPGVTQKLDYLADLGITAIWLMPIHPSTDYHGYSVEDYYQVDPEYGSTNDIRELVKEAHNRSMRIVMDLVINHTSRTHPWFIASKTNQDPVLRDYYVWSTTDPQTVGPNGRVWHKNGNGYYLGLFSSRMPDLNLQNPRVTAEIDRIVDYWVGEIGMDGFRIDAAKHLVESGKQIENTAETHAWLKAFAARTRKKYPEVLLIGEVFGSDARLAETYSTDELDLVFNFEFANGLLNSARGGSNSGIRSAITFAQDTSLNWRFGTFLSNHDQTRAMTTLAGKSDRAKIAAALMLTSPGIPFLYYGEEIGLEGNKPDENIREPMHWDNSRFNGFSSVQPWRYKEASRNTDRNVAAAERDPESLFQVYKQLIHLRKNHPALSAGNMQLVQSSDPRIHAFIRANEQETLLVILNLAETTISNPQFRIESGKIMEGRHELVLIYGESNIQSYQIDKGDIHFSPEPFELKPYNYIVFQID